MKFRWETEFKETEIGEIPRDWEVEQIKDIAKVTTGGTPSRKEPRYWNGKINWLKSQEVNDNYIYETEEKISEEGMKNSNAKIIYPPGTLVIAIYAAPTAGRVSILKTFTTINQALAALESKNNKFLFYSFIANRERLLLQASGAAQQNLNLELLKEFLIPYPPLPEQNRIATILSYFDDLIENKKRQNEILEKTAMAIFKNWFIDFEPFKDGEFVDSELGKIPKGWEVKKLKNFAYITMGQSPPSYAYNELGLGNPFIQGKGQFGKYTPQTNVYCSVAGKKCQEKDILLTVRAPIGELNIADQEYIIGRGVASLRSNCWCYLFLFLSSSNEKLKSY